MNILVASIKLRHSSTAVPTASSNRALLKSLEEQSRLSRLPNNSIMSASAAAPAGKKQQGTLTEGILPLAHLTSQPASQLIFNADLQATYSNYKNTLQQVAQKIGDIEQEAEEHK